MIAVPLPAGVCVQTTRGATVPNVKPQLPQLLRHSGASVAAQRQLMLLPDMRQQHHIRALAPLMLVNKHCRAVVGSSDGIGTRESHAD